MSNIRYGLFMLAELGMRVLINPRLRAQALKILGAHVGRNVRVYECQFINVSDGFANLVLGDDVHIGAGCLIDLQGRVGIGRGSVLSPRVVVISHADPGSSHGSPITKSFVPDAAGVQIGQFCWIGASSTILSGARIGDEVVIGAGALARGALAGPGVYVGVPARAVGARRVIPSD